jgi:hypothetical protein
VRDFSRMRTGLCELRKAIRLAAFDAGFYKGFVYVFNLTKGCNIKKETLISVPVGRFTYFFTSSGCVML